MNPKRQRLLVLVITLVAVAILWLLFWSAGDTGPATEGLVETAGDTSSRSGEDDTAAVAEAVTRRKEALARASVLDLRLNVDTLERLEDESRPAAALLKEQGPDANVTAGEIHLLDLIGKPVSKGTVRFVEGPSAGRLLHTGGGGIVALKGIRAGKHIIEVSGPSTFRRFLRLVYPQDRITVIRWGPPTSIHGTVSDEENRSLPGIEVNASGRSATTDELGQYRIEGLFPGVGTPLSVRAKGFATTEVAVDLQPGIPLRHHFVLSVLSRGATVAGRVQLPAGEEKAARLYLMPIAMGRTSRELTFPFQLRGSYAEVPIGSDGSFEVDGLPAPAAMQVVLRHPRFTLAPVPFTLATAGLQKERLILGPDPAPLVTGQVRAVRTRRSSGRVHTVRGEGIEGATVEVHPVRDGSESPLVPVSPETLAVQVIPRDVIDLEWAETRSDAKGNYSLPIRKGGAFMVLTASASGYHPASLSILGVASSRRDLELVAISGDEAGKDAASLRLSFGRTGASAPQLRITLLRDGVQESTPFPWSSAQPYVLRFSVPSRVHVLATFEDAGQVLSRSETDVAVRGEVTVTIALPAQ